MRVPEAQIKKLIHQSNLIEGYDIPEYDEQSLHTWRWLCNAGLSLQSLGHSDVRKVQKMITLPQTDLEPWWRGYYRSVSKVNVTIAGRPGMKPEHIDAAMGDWVFRFPTADPKQHHIEFEQIHPFVDGNGRTGRMLMWWQEMMMDMPLTEIKKSEVAEYYAWFR